MEYHIIDVFTDKLFGGNPAGVWHPGVVLIVALTLIVLLILLFYFKGILRLYKVKI